MVLATQLTGTALSYDSYWNNAIVRPCLFIMPFPAYVNNNNSYCLLKACCVAASHALSHLILTMTL